MNIQIFGKAKCFDTKKAERWFKERRIKYQYIDVLKYGMSKGEISSVKNAVGLNAMVDPSDQDYPLFQYLATTEAKLDKLYEVPELITDVRTQVRDIAFDRPPCLDKNVSVSRAWDLLRENHTISALPVINKNGTLFGLVTAVAKVLRDKG